MCRQSILGILVVSVALGCGSDPGAPGVVPAVRAGAGAGFAGASSRSMGGESLGGSAAGNFTSTPAAGGADDTVVDAGGGAAQIPTKPSGNAGAFSSGIATGGMAGRSGYGTAGSYGDPDPTNCANPWPQAKVMPTVGIYFFGPDPGPCVQTAPTPTGVNTSVFSYQSGHIASITTGSMVKTYSWEQGVLAASEWRSGTQVVNSSSYVWTTDAVTETLNGGEVRRYVFGASGYPKEVWVSSLTASYSPYVAVRYEYGDCRLTRRIVFRADGSVDEPTTSVFEYDSKGHIVKQRYGSSLVETFDYSCW